MNLFFKVMNLPPQTLMLWNGLTLTHCVVRIVKLALTSLLGDLPNTMGRGNRKVLRVDNSIKKKSNTWFSYMTIIIKHEILGSDL
jgi:hypothetical protein